MTMQKSLAQIESMLATLVGGQVTKTMAPAEFVQYAHGQIVKAMGEPRELSTRRLKALQRSVSVCLSKDNYTNDEEVNVPVFVDDTTALDERETQLSTAQQAAGTNPAGKTAFEQGLVSKFAALKAQFDALVKEMPDDDDEEEKRKAAGDEDDTGDEEKRAGKKAFPPPKKPPFPPKKPDDDDDEKVAAKKGLDVSRDGTAWPADLNDAAFKKTGKVEKSLDWGRD